MSVPFFPSAYPDEALFSIIARYAALSGNRSKDITLIQLLGSRSPVTFTGLPCRLSYLINQLPPDCDLNSERLIETYTLLPYLRPFLSKKQVSEAIRLMLGSDGSGIKVGLGIPASRVGATERLRYCPECFLRDQRECGSAYWHRSHLLPGVMVCQQHAVPLREIRFKPNHPLRHGIFLPTDAQDCEFDIEQFSFSTGQMNILSRIARNSTFLLHAGLTSLCRDAVLSAYKHRLDEIGLLTRNGSVRQIDFFEFLTGFYAAISKITPYSNLFGKCNIDHWWAASLLRHPKKSTHPLKHLLIILSLYDSFEEFVDRINVQQQSVKIEPIDSSWKNTDITRLRHLLVDQKLSLRLASEMMGISVTTLSIEAAKHRIPLTRSRPKKHGQKIRCLAVKMLRKGEAKAEISKELNLSVVYLNRLLRSEPRLNYLRQNSIFRCRRRNYRSLLMNELAFNHAVSRAELRRLMSGIWTWLYRHDTEWLFSTLPGKIQAHSRPKPVIDWKHRDIEIASKLSECANRLLSQDGEPIRITKPTLIRATDQRYLIEKRIEMLPETAERLRILCESVEDFQVRRVRYVAAKLTKEGIVPLPWRIKKDAGLSETIAIRVAMAIEESVKYRPLVENTNK